MEIVVEDRPARSRMPRLVRNHENPDSGGRKDQALMALMAEGMSEQTALEQITRLSAGDIWSG